MESVWLLEEKALCVFCFVCKRRGFGRWSFLYLRVCFSGFQYWISVQEEGILCWFSFGEPLTPQTGGQYKPAVSLTHLSVFPDKLYFHNHHPVGKETEAMNFSKVTQLKAEIWIGGLWGMGCLFCQLLAILPLSNPLSTVRPQAYLWRDLMGKPEDMFLLSLWLLLFKI